MNKISVAISKRGVPIRLTAERWAHVTEEHCELAGMWQDVLLTVAEPEKIFEGNHGALIAVRSIDLAKWLVTVYREQAEDGFLITAFITSRKASLLKRRQVWP